VPDAHDCGLTARLGSATASPRGRECCRRVHLERKSDAEAAGGKADGECSDENERDALGIQHQPPWEIRLSSV
jgi:hypothetical protein